LPGEAEPRVSTLELFFDLVFLFTLTQLTPRPPTATGPPRR
jgi:low temperature requirement protein LtrA